MRLVYLLFFASCTPTEAPPPPPPEPPPSAEFVFETVDAVGLRNLVSAPTGHMRVINFWATWCGPCRAELPELRAFAQRDGSTEVVLVNVDHRAIRKRKAPQVIREFQLESLRHVGLSDRDVNRTLKTAIDDWPDSIPVTMVIDGQGKQLKRFLGAVNARRLQSAVTEP